jgi:multiple sugar transport system permease protein
MPRQQTGEGGAKLETRPEPGSVSQPDAAQSSQGVQRRRRRAPAWQRSEQRWAFTLMSPFMLGLLIFVVGPTVAAIVLSFTDWNLLGSIHWIGFSNYTALYHDSLFRKVVLNTVYYTVAVVPLSIILGLALATFLNNKAKGIWIFRILLFTPVTVPVVAGGLLWAWMMTPSYGLINYLLHFVGLPQFAWISGIQTAMPSIILVGVWRAVGLNIVLFLAALQGVDKSVQEAAALDGAGRWRIYWRVTLPLMTPTVFFAVIIAVISSFQVFDQTYIMTQGGPANNTMTVIYYIFLEGFTYLRMGYASAISTLFTVAVFILTLIAIRYQRLWVFYGED